MHVPRAVWALGYYVCTAAALAAMGAVSAQIVVENLDAVDSSDAYVWLGAAAGALLGLSLARWKRSSPTTHRVLCIAGAGLEFVIMGVLALCVVGIGACLWLAGFSGRRIAPTSATAGGAPLE